VGWTTPLPNRRSAPKPATLVLHIDRELIHHGGEIGLMRDLYRVHNT
jgi:hypothetical protein